MRLSEASSYHLTQAWAVREGNLIRGLANYVITRTSRTTVGRLEEKGKLHRAWYQTLFIFGILYHDHEVMAPLIHSYVWLCMFQSCSVPWDLSMVGSCGQIVIYRLWKECIVVGILYDAVFRYFHDRFCTSPLDPSPEHPFLDFAEAESVIGHLQLFFWCHYLLSLCLSLDWFSK